MKKSDLPLAQQLKAISFSLQMEWAQIRLTMSQIKNLILEKAIIRWLKATGYAEAIGVRLIFVFLGMPWVRDAARLAFIDVPPTCTVIVAD